MADRLRHGWTERCIVLVNNSFAFTNPLLLAGGGGHRLLVLALMGGIIGAIGV
jgi:hypothetical protein